MEGRYIESTLAVVSVVVPMECATDTYWVSARGGGDRGRSPLRSPPPEDELAARECSGRGARVEGRRGERLDSGELDVEGRLPVIVAERGQYSSRMLYGCSPSSSKRSSTCSTTSLISPIHAACICCPSRNVALIFLCWRARERSRASSEWRTEVREVFVDMVDWRSAFESSSAWTERARRLSR